MKASQSAFETQHNFASLSRSSSVSKEKMLYRKRKRDEDTKEGPDRKHTAKDGVVQVVPPLTPAPSHEQACTTHSCKTAGFDKGTEKEPSRKRQTRGGGQVPGQVVTSQTPAQQQQAPSHEQIRSFKKKRLDKDTKEDPASQNGAKAATNNQKRPPEKQKCSLSSESDLKVTRLLQQQVMFNGKYEYVRTLGKGSFGIVTECIDYSKDRMRVAVKFSRGPEANKELKHELRMLKRINSLNSKKKFACMQMLDSFDHHGHFCIVFELLGLGTHECLYGFSAFTVDQVRHMAGQIFRAVNFLHQSHIAHTDLKPQNILLADSRIKRCSDLNPKTKMRKMLDVKVADFGNAMYTRRLNRGLVTSRPYRAPEVILGLGWNQACDVWSLGCVLFEYYKGHKLFMAPDDLTHIVLMKKVLGPIPTHLFDELRKQHSIDYTLSSYEILASGRHPLREYLCSSRPDDVQLFDLIEKMLEFDSSKRITLEDAIKHPFFSPLKDEGMGR